MSVAFYIVLDEEKPGFDTFVNGRALAWRDDLDEVARALGVRPLSGFGWVSDEEMAHIVGEAPAKHAPAKPGEPFFAADEGLATVRALRAHYARVADAEAVVEDLDEYEEVLAQAAARGFRFHLAIDL
jgi:hypothetical protein